MLVGSSFLSSPFLELCFLQDSSIEIRILKIGRKLKKESQVESTKFSSRRKKEAASPKTATRTIQGLRG
ncbi:hypothetical protein L2E82_27601 [Cichorium intybus]|uniref:Uncharacterized protein n=1 Tax=Cichorium intybus TaxID=13427 RepID=A0ACB9CTT6_CICIN|nr:hypothetical protein L2E82_27601 [Cichorium intybus]